MSNKIKSILVIIFIILIIALSRFTTLADTIKATVVSFMAKPAQNSLEINGFTPYLLKKAEIINELSILRTQTDANGVGLVLFHDEKKNLTTVGNYFFTILYEVVRQGFTTTTDIFIDIPVQNIPSFNIKASGGCSGVEVGNSLTGPAFLNLPPRPTVLCVLYKQNRIVGAVYIVDSYNRIQLNELVKYIPNITETSNKIEEIVG